MKKLRTIVCGNSQPITFEKNSSIKIMGKFENKFNNTEIELLKYIDYHYIKIFMNNQFNEQLK